MVMNPFLMMPKERLDDWKKFRNGLKELPESDQLEAVAHYWSQAPMKKIAHDVDSPKTWPSAWQMISDGEWCRNSTAIGMEAMLRLSGWDSSRLDLRLINDTVNSEIVFILVIDGELVLNQEWGAVSKYPQTGVRVMRKYRWNGRGHTE